MSFHDSPPDYDVDLTTANITQLARQICIAQCFTNIQMEIRSSNPVAAEISAPQLSTPCPAPHYDGDNDQSDQ